MSNKEVILILRDADENTPGTTEVKIQWTSRGIEIQPAGTGTSDVINGPPIFIERHKGHVRVVIWSDIENEEPTHIVSLDGARENIRGQGPEVAEIIKKSLPATYTSEWDNGTVITSPCMYDPEKQECFDIEDSDVDVGNASLVREYVTLGDMELGEDEGVTFNY